MSKSTQRSIGIVAVSRSGLSNGQLVLLMFLVNGRLLRHGKSCLSAINGAIKLVP
jgi:hypothetical protein